MATSYYKKGKRIIRVRDGKETTLNEIGSANRARVMGGWSSVPDYSTYKPAGKPLVNKVSPPKPPKPTQTTTPPPNTPAGQPQTAYQPTLIEITSQRPDVLAEARKQGGDPYTAGTGANRWLNDWYNRVGKAEGADMARRGLFDKPEIKPVGEDITITEPP